MSQDKKYSTSSSFSFVVDPNGAWVPRELSLKRVHVYSYFQFTERMLWDNCITKCIYLFIIFYLKLTYITACLLKQKESEQNGECGSDYSNSCLCFKVPVIWYIYLLCFSFLFLSACLWTCSREMAGRSCLVTLKKKRKKRKKEFPHEVSTITTSICGLLSNQWAATWKPTQSPSVWISNVYHKSCLFLSCKVINCLNR